MVALKNLLATRSDCWYLLADLYADASSRLSDKTLLATFKIRAVPAIDVRRTTDFAKTNEFFLALQQYDAFLERLCEFVTVEDTQYATNRCREYLEQVVVMQLSLCCAHTNVQDASTLLKRKR